MNNWFEVCVKYQKINETSGKDEKVSEWFLIDAASFTEAEARIYKETEAMIRGEFMVDKIRRSKVNEVFPYEDGELWFKAGVEWVTIDENNGKEKKAKNEVLVMGDDLHEALNRIDDSFKDMLVPYVVSSVSVSQILDIFPYFKEEESENQPI